jgi:hypothetical protein
MAVIFSDTFTDTDGTTLASHAPTVGTSYTVIDNTVPGAFTAEINTNQLRSISPGYGAFYRWKLNPSSAYAANHTVSFGFGANIGNVGRGSYEFQCRVQGSGERYDFRVDYNYSTSSTDVTASILHVSSGGTETVLATGTFAPSAFADEPIVCGLNGTSLTMTRNGSALLSVTDGTITGAGDVNLLVWCNSFGNGARIDNLSIDNTAGGTTVAKSVFPFFLGN